MSTTSISAAGNYALSTSISQSDIDFLMTTEISKAAPRFSDPNPKSPVSYAERLAKKLYREYLSTSTITHEETIDSNGRTIVIEVLQYGILLFQHTVTYDAAGVMDVVAYCAPYVSIAAKYAKGSLASCLVCTPQVFFMRHYSAEAKLIRVLCLVDNGSTSEPITGVMIDELTFEETEIMTDRIDGFATQITMVKRACTPMAAPAA